MSITLEQLESYGKIHNKFENSLTKDSTEFKDYRFLINGLNNKFPDKEGSIPTINDMDNQLTFLYNNIPPSFNDNTKTNFIQMINDERTVFNLKKLPTTVNQTQFNSIELNQNNIDAINSHILMFFSNLLHFDKNKTKDINDLLNEIINKKNLKRSDYNSITIYLYNNIPSYFDDDTKKEFIQMIKNIRNAAYLPPTIPTSIISSIKKILTTSSSSIKKVLSSSSNQNDIVSTTQGNQIEHFFRNFKDNLSQDSQKDMDILFGRMNEQFPIKSDSELTILYTDNITTFLYKNIPLSFGDNTKKEFIQMLNNIRNVVNLPPLFTSIISSIKKVITTSSSSIKKVITTSSSSIKKVLSSSSNQNVPTPSSNIKYYLIIVLIILLAIAYFFIKKK